MKKVLLLLASLFLILSTAPAVSAASAPSAPNGFILYPTDDGVRVTLGSVDGAAGYNIYRNNRYVGTVNDSGQPTSTWTENVSPGTYTYYITSFDSSRTQFSGRSVTRTITVGTPDAPARFALYDVDSGVRLTIGTRAAAAGYNIYRNDRYVGTVNDTGGQTVTWVDNVSPGTYTYYITSFDQSRTRFSNKSTTQRITVN